MILKECCHCVFYQAECKDRLKRYCEETDEIEEQKNRKQEKKSERQIEQYFLESKLFEP